MFLFYSFACCDSYVHADSCSDLWLNTHYSNYISMAVGFIAYRGVKSKQIRAIE